MGLRDAYPGANPVKMAKEALAADIARRNEAAKLQIVYEEDASADQLLRQEITGYFDDPTIRAKVGRFASIGQAVTLFRRVIDTTSKTAYQIPPTRTITPPEFQDAYRKIEQESELDQRMDEACRFTNAYQGCYVYGRNVPRLKRIVYDVISPAMSTPIWDPDDSRVELALIVNKSVMRDGGYVTWNVYWDDEIMFQMDENGNVVPQKVLVDGLVVEQAFVYHGKGRMPFAAIRRIGPSSKHLYRAHIACVLFTALSGRLLKAQGFNQLWVQTATPGKIAKGNIHDEEAATVTDKETSLTVLNTKSDARHYLDLVEFLRNDAAAARGVSRSRLNQNGKDETDGDGLVEERADAIAYMRPGEQKVFSLTKHLSQEFPESARRIPDEAQMATDFGEIEARVDPMLRTQIWDALRKMGLRNILDDIKALNPEIRTDPEAEAELERNIRVTTKWVAKIRALNMAHDVQTGEPGQTAEENGKLGPLKRDGKITGDQAAAIAKGGPKKDLKAIARKALKNAT